MIDHLTTIVVVLLTMSTLRLNAEDWHQLRIFFGFFCFEIWKEEAFFVFKADSASQEVSGRHGIFLCSVHIFLMFNGEDEPNYNVVVANCINIQMNILKVLFIKRRPNQTNGLLFHIIRLAFNYRSLQFSPNHLQGLIHNHG